MIIIKTQSKDAIMKVEHVTVLEHETGAEVGTIIQNRLFSLGTYETKERAKEVFNEICNAIKKGSKRDFIDHSEYKQKKNRIHQELIFEMPEI